MSARQDKCWNELTEFARSSEDLLLEKLLLRRLVSGTFLLLPIILWLAMVGVGIFGIATLEKAHNSAREDRQVMEKSILAIDNLRNAQVHFKKQVQAWKNLLLRGPDSINDYERYLAEFKNEEHKVQIFLNAAKPLLYRLELPKQIKKKLEKLIHSHIYLGGEYRRALAEENPDDQFFTGRVDRRVRGIDRTPTADMDRLVTAVYSWVRDSNLAAVKRDEANYHLQYIRMLIALAVLALIVFPLVFIGVRRYLKHIAANRDAAQNANRAKSAFLATMSHEIRTPLNAILGMLELLGEAPLKQQYMEKIKIAAGSGKTLLSLINNILDYSKIEAGHLTLDNVDFDLHELLNEVIQSLAVLAHMKRVELVAYIPQQFITDVRGDPNRLRQIFTNLISNAIKFTPEGGLVECHGGPIAQSGNSFEYIFEIRDNGIGIPTEKHGIIFESFTQADISTTRQYGGTGLGLAICKRLVNMMGGDIGVESNPYATSGTIFHFAIKLQKQQRPSTILQNRSLDDVRALIVGSQGLQSAFLSDIFYANQGHYRHISEISDIPDTLSLAVEQGQPYNLVIINQPLGENRIKDLNKLQDKINGIHFILLVDMLDQGWDQASALDGEVVCLKKPFSTDNFYAAIATLFNKSDLLQSRPAAPLSPATLKENWKNARILVVDDVNTNLKVTVGLLESVGCDANKCVTAQNGLEAVKLFCQTGFDLVLMDCQMPLMDGYQATSTIRKWEKEQQKHAVPIVGFTADVTIDSQNAGIAAGMDDFLLKPLTMQELRSFLEKTLPQSSAITEAATTPITVAVPAKQKVIPALHEVKATLISMGLSEQDIPEVAMVISTQLPELMDNLERDIGEENFDLVRATSHVLKGTMANTLFPSLKAFTPVLHENVLSQNWDGAREQLAMVRAEYAPIGKVLLALAEK